MHSVSIVSYRVNTEGLCSLNSGLSGMPKMSRSACSLRMPIIHDSCKKIRGRWQYRTVKTVKVSASLNDESVDMSGMKVVQGRRFPVDRNVM